MSSGVCGAPQHARTSCARALLRSVWSKSSTSRSLRCASTRRSSSLRSCATTSLRTSSPEDRYLGAASALRSGEQEGRRGDARQLHVRARPSPSVSPLLLVALRLDRGAADAHAAQETRVWWAQRGRVRCKGWSEQAATSEEAAHAHRPELVHPGAGACGASSPPPPRCSAPSGAQPPARRQSRPGSCRSRSQRRCSCEDTSKQQAGMMNGVRPFFPRHHHCITGQ